jgi:hypothetical protein
VAARYCAGRRTTEDDNLLTNYPDVAGQWHPTRNGDKKPEDFRPGSDVKVWWLCARNHEWEARIKSRTRTNGTGCPYCAKRVSEEDNLLSNYPDVASQWHPTKNGDKKPEAFRPGSGEKVWWLCERNHEWEATIVNKIRPKGSGCPLLCWAEIIKGLLQALFDMKNVDIESAGIELSSDRLSKNY